MAGFELCASSGGVNVLPPSEVHRFIFILNETTNCISLIMTFIRVSTVVVYSFYFKKSTLNIRIIIFYFIVTVVYFIHVANPVRYQQPQIE